jgi:hypothetical protein
MNEIWMDVITREGTPPPPLLCCTTHLSVGIGRNDFSGRRVDDLHIHSLEWHSHTTESSIREIKRAGRDHGTGLGEAVSLHNRYTDIFEELEHWKRSGRSSRSHSSKERERRWIRVITVRVRVRVRVISSTH